MIALSNKRPLLALLALATMPILPSAQDSEARQWNDLLLESIRNDLARPTVHARNLFHTSIGMWDAWATYDSLAEPVLFDEDHATALPEIDLLRSEALSFSSYQILKVRFANSPGAATMLPQYDALMDSLGYDKLNTSTVGDTPAEIGNRIAATVLAYGAIDNSNEIGDYANLSYLPVNQALLPEFPGNPTLTDPMRWQPLSLEFFIDQAGNPIPFGYPDFISPEWGQVSNWGLSQHDLTIEERDNFSYYLFHDPGPPPAISDPEPNLYKVGFEMVSIWSSHLDPSDGVMIDVSPNSIGNAPLPLTQAEVFAFYDVDNGGDWGTGYALNPVTGSPYPTQIVPRGDYTRILAEFWADGPDSETPPGHWFVLLNDVADHPSFQKRIGGTGPVVNDLEWCVKSYLAMGGAMHDCAVAAWGAKGWYDYLRPISAIRYCASLGQCSIPGLPNFDLDGIHLRPGFIEMVTPTTTALGGIHEHLAGEEGKIAILAWRGPTLIQDPLVDTAGVGWILAENWWPYQRPSFVTPPFSGYVSGHSTYSRAAAIVMDMLTGSPYFPDGLGEYVALQNEFLVFEDGPSVEVRLQWASYYDASDQCSLSRIWGGIHPPADDIPGRLMGEKIGPKAYSLAEDYWDGTACDAAGSIEIYGNGCEGDGGFIPHLSMVGCPEPGGTLQVRIQRGAPSGLGFLLVGLTQSSIPLGGGCELLVPVTASVVSINMNSNPGVAGSGEFSALFTPSPATVPGTQLTFQAAVIDLSTPSFFTLSNGLALTIE